LNLNNPAEDGGLRGVLEHFKKDRLDRKSNYVAGNVILAVGNNCGFANGTLAKK